MRIPSISLALLAAATASVAGGQLLPGGGGVSGAVGGLGGTIGNATGQAGGAVGGVGDTVGGVARGLGGSIDQGLEPVAAITRSDIEQAIRPTLSRVNTERWMRSVPAATLADLRRLRLAELVKQHSGELEMDGAGNPARRGELLLVDPSEAQIRQSAALGFSVTADERDPELGLRTVTLRVPKGQSLAKAAVTLRRALPGASVDFNHVFEPAGGELAATAVGGLAASAQAGSGRLIGMIDGGVANAPALARAGIEQKGFSGPAQPTGHGTAVASLIVGADGRFRGAASGARLAVGDVYGGKSSAGSARAIVGALSWLAAKRPAAINISLVGPRNAAVERAVAVLMRRGVTIVAAVGNDGPAAPALYPASQPGVIAVTGVDRANRAIPEAGRNANLAYAAPGADMVAALPGKGYTAVRGTSFAAPFVSARVAALGNPGGLAREASKGHGRVGRGVVCADCEIAPKAMGLK